MMTVAAARALDNEDVCFVGIGLPSAACNLARLTHAPGITLVYESGTLDTKPDGAAALDRRRRAVRNRAHHGVGPGDVSLLAAGRTHHRWLSGRRAGGSFRQPEQHGDRPIRKPKVRLPGSGRRDGDRDELWHASSSSCGTERASFVERLDFLTTLGHGRTGRERRALGIATEGPALLVTDLCMMRPEPETKEFDGDQRCIRAVTREQVREKTGWEVRFAAHVGRDAPPSADELEALRDLHARTRRAHGAAGGDE